MSEPGAAVAEDAEELALDEGVEITWELGSPRLVPADPYPGPPARPASWPPPSGSKARR
jgi:hypothetical protein